jgi:hypothetical protein
MQYNFFTESVSKRWSFEFHFLLSFKKICVQPVHVCLDSEELTLAIGLVFVRAVIRIEHWKE